MRCESTGSPPACRRCAAALLLCGLAFAAQAAERPAENPPDEAPPAPAAPDRAARAGEPEAARSEGPQQEVFLPSEEISEDFAAPFPVDI